MANFGDTHQHGIGVLDTLGIFSGLHLPGNQVFETTVIILGLLAPVIAWPVLKLQDGHRARLERGVKQILVWLDLLWFEIMAVSLQRYLFSHGTMCAGFTSRALNQGLFS